MKRRTFVQAMSSVLSGFAASWAYWSTDPALAQSGATRQPNDPAARATTRGRSRMEGLILGGLIGDAMGGPIEFSQSQDAAGHLTNARAWPAETQLDERRLVELQSIPLLDYVDLRPETAPYGPWRPAAPAGTLTDDSRHKIVLMRAIRLALSENRGVTKDDLARQFLQFEPAFSGQNEQALRKLNEEGFREYRLASRWLLGERDLNKARPVERLWAGINNCSGQMLLPPLAGLFPGQPEKAYRAAFDLDFIDAPTARDIASALVAGLASALDPHLDNVPSPVRWQALLSSMRTVDPFKISEVPFAGRPLHRWMDKAEELAERADRRPAVLYRLLETEGKPVYWWDAHFTLLVPLSVLHLCQFDPLASLHLTLDFGHDTDSYAQVLGCMLGAVHGREIFESTAIDAVTQTLRTDYNEDITEWFGVFAKR